MRTKKEIKEWLRDRGCINLFYKNYKTRPSDWRWATETVEGLFLLDFDSVINDAFRWSDTPEGHGFWSDINNDFLDWY